MRKSVLIITILLILQSFFFSCRSTSFDEEIKAVENGLLKAVVVKGDSVARMSIEDRMKYHKVPGVSIAVVRDGKLRWAKGYGFADTNDSTRVDENTLFQAGSISKPLAALAALKLVDEGKADLDADVNTYLKGWKVENNRFTETEKVTLRRLLTHTAGTTVHGFPGYSQTDSFPSDDDVLSGRGNTPAVMVDTIPGSIWRYSGGGYTVMEKVVEDISGMPFENYMEEHILRPLGMKNSTCEQPLSEKYHRKASAAYDAQGTIIEGLWHNYPEQAAAGLWTTPSDLAKYYIGVYDVMTDKTESVLSKETVGLMLTKDKNNWGLGPALSGEGDSLRFQHGGKNAGFTNYMTGFARRGDAVIVMTNADNGGKLTDEILRSVSDYYEWGIAEPRLVELESSDAHNMEPLLGRYVLDEQIPGIGNYYLEFVKEGEKLIVIDSIAGERVEMGVLDSLHFIDLESGEEMIFSLSNDTTAFMWGNRFRFIKVEE